MSRSLAPRASVLALLFAAACATPRVVPPDPSSELFAVLDADGDGLLYPDEAPVIADALDLVAPVTEAELAGLLLEDRVSDALLEAREIIAEIDLDSDARISRDEFAGAEAPIPFEDIDSDGSGFITEDEIAELLSEEFEEDPYELVADLLDTFGGDDGTITLDLLPEDFEDLAEADVDGDGVLVRDELLTLFAAELTEAVFEVDGDVARMTGVIGPTTPRRVLELFVFHPDVRTIELVQVPGSMDDEANLLAARMVRRAGLGTRVANEGSIASGGVDFFLAGTARSLGEGARVGVHSWGSGDFSAVDIPRDHPAHYLYLDYYRAGDVADDFYWFTLEAALAEEIHWMTTSEITRFGMTTR